MKLKVEKNGDHAVIGGQLSQAQIEALSSISVQPDHILNHMDDLNEELTTVNTEKQETKVNNMPKRKPPMSNNTSTFQRTRKRKTVEDDFDQALNDIEAQVDEKAEHTETNNTNVEESVGDGSMKSQILDLLKETPNAPSQAQINKWKTIHGENAVHVMAFGKGDVYIYTHLKRGQWKKIQEVMAKIQETQNTDAEDALKEKVLQYCVLWPSSLPLEFFYNSRAGVVDSLYQVILLNSYFLSPQQAMLLTTQL